MFQKSCCFGLRGRRVLLVRSENFGMGRVVITSLCQHEFPDKDCLYRIWQTFILCLSGL